MTDDTNDDLYDLLASLVGQAAKYQARIEELEAAQDWQPIETAPKDGTMVFVWFPDTPKALRGEYEDRIKLGKFVEGLQEWVCSRCRGRYASQSNPLETSF